VGARRTLGLWLRFESPRLQATSTDATAAGVCVLLLHSVPPHPSSGGGDAPGGSSHGGAGTPRSANGHSSGGGGGVPGGRLSVFCPPDAERSGLPPMQYSAAAGVSGGGTPVNFAAQHLADGSSTAPARGQQMLGLGQFQAAAGGSGGGSRMGLNMLQSASSAEDDAAAAVTAEHMARMVLSEGSSSSLTSPAGVKAASGSDAAAAIAAAAGFGGRGGSSSNVSSGNTLFDVLARRRTIVHAPVGTPISAPAAASSASGALPSPALAHGLPPVHGGGVAARHAAAAAAFAGSGGGARRGKGVLQALSQVCAFEWVWVWLPRRQLPAWVTLLRFGSLQCPLALPPHACVPVCVSRPPCLPIPPGRSR
jgi:hypothetical protein